MKLFTTITVFMCIISSTIAQCMPDATGVNNNFSVVNEWQSINFTWQTDEDYENMLANQSYVPGNITITDVKFGNNTFFFVLSKLKIGSPISVAYMKANMAGLTNVVLTPYPSWQMNTSPDCLAFKDVSSIEITSTNSLWVLDARRINSYLTCQAGLYIFNLNKTVQLNEYYYFPEAICNPPNCLLNNIVVDSTNGFYAYMADSGADSGIVVFSLCNSTSWKVQYNSMLPEALYVNFIVNGINLGNNYPIAGIALSSQIDNIEQQRYVFFSALNGVYLYKVNTMVLQNENLSTSTDFNSNVINVGQKHCPSNGMIIDYADNLYYVVSTENKVVTWQINLPLNSSTTIATQNDYDIWSDSFCFDLSGNLYVLSNNMETFIENEISFNTIRLMKYYTGTCNYDEA